MNYGKFKNELFKAARKAGFKDFELYYYVGDTFRVGIYQGDIDTYNVSSSIGVGFRGIFNGKMGYSYSEKIDAGTIDMLVDCARENALIIDSNDPEFINNQADTYSEADTYCDKLSEVKAEDKIKFALELEKCMIGCDSRVRKVQTCIFGSFDNSVTISNSYGLELSYKTNGAFSIAVPVLVSGNETQTAAAYIVGREFERFDPEELAREAVSNAAAYFGAEPVSSGKYRILIKNEAACDILETFSSIFIADSVQKGLSLLKGKIGQRIASEKLIVLDDPLLPGGMASCPFDAEGVASRTKELIRNGELVTFLYNLKTAHKDGVKSTGNAARSSYASKVGTSATNFYIKPGTRPLDEMLNLLQDGLYITEVQGLHAGANSVSGDFSLAAKGFAVKNGKIDKAVEQITIAGNFYSLLENIEEIGSDLRFGIPSGGYFGSPAILVKELSVAGK